MKRCRTTCFACFTLLSLSLHAQQPAEDDFDAWFDNTDEEKALRVNEGELKFLSAIPENKIIHQVTNTITISPDSLKNQWVSLHQCHKNLDPVAESEIVYRYKNMRNLRVQHYQGMENAWVEQQTVQMKAISKGASVCITAEAHILRPGPTGEYHLTNGPYFRKFLDGYYPFQVNLNIHYPSTLRVKTIQPEPQTGLSVVDDKHTLTINALFEGKLTLQVYFRQSQ